MLICLVLSLAMEKNLPGKIRMISGFRLGTLAQIMPVPTSTTDQLRLETHAWEKSTLSRLCSWLKRIAEAAVALR
jgi:hypothetical protein